MLECTQPPFCGTINSDVVQRGPLSAEVKLQFISSLVSMSGGNIRLIHVYVFKADIKRQHIQEKMNSRHHET